MEIALVVAVIAANRDLDDPVTATREVLDALGLLSERGRGSRDVALKGLQRTGFWLTILVGYMVMTGGFVAGIRAGIEAELLLLRQLASLAERQKASTESRNASASSRCRFIRHKYRLFASTRAFASTCTPAR